MKEYEQKWLKKLDETIEVNLKNPNFNLIELAYDLAISPAQLYRQTKALTEKSPKAYIRNQRLWFAKDLITNQTRELLKIS